MKPNKVNNWMQTRTFQPPKSSNSSQNFSDWASAGVMTWIWRHLQQSRFQSKSQQHLHYRKGCSRISSSKPTTHKKEWVSNRKNGTCYHHFTRFSPICKRERTNDSKERTKFWKNWPNWTTHLVWWQLINSTAKWLEKYFNLRRRKRQACSIWVSEFMQKTNKTLFNLPIEWPSQVYHSTRICHHIFTWPPYTPNRPKWSDKLLVRWVCKGSK